MADSVAANVEATFAQTNARQPVFCVDLSRSADHNLVQDARPGTVSAKPLHEVGIAEGDKSAAGNAAGEYAVERAKAHLIADAHACMAPMPRAFAMDIDGFIEQARKRNISDNEITRSLDATSRLLDGEGKKPLQQAERVWLAQTLMHNLNHSGRIDQGFHNTCNVTAIEKRLFTIEPARAAEMLSSTALNGEYVASDGKCITIDRKSMNPDSEVSGGATTEAHRNYASQLFDLISINNYWQRCEPHLSYIQGPKEFQGDTGERLLQADGTPVRDRNGKVHNSPGLDCRAMNAIGAELGFTDKFLIANRAADVCPDNLQISSEKEFANTLQQLSEQGRLPAVIFVNSGNKLFTGTYNEGGSGGWHVVTVDAYDQKTGMVHLCNQWGEANDRNVLLSDLYDATLPASMWKKCPGYRDKDTIERFHRYMFDGGAGLEKDGVWTAKYFDDWLIQVKHQKCEIMLNTLNDQLRQAEAAKDSVKIQTLRAQIQQVQNQQ